MPRAFVVGACIANGGTLMAYHIGRILELDFGYQGIAVRVGTEQWDETRHAYDLKFPIVSIEEMEKTISDDDLMIVNPSFSRFHFGTRCPGRKISYVQGFNTFPLLDARLDRYVAVSGFVQNFLRQTYAIDAPVIPPFVERVDMPEPVDWSQRPAQSVFTYVKDCDGSAPLFFDRFKSIVGSRATFHDSSAAMALPRRELLERIASSQYFLSLSAAEGFGLVPLEAMALGTVVVGFDGFGGRQYFEPGLNSAVIPYPRIEAAADNLLRLTEQPELAQRLSAAGRETAARYTYETFREAWCSFFIGSMGMTRQT